MSKRTAWIAAFLTVTAAAVGQELWAAYDASGSTVPWTDLITRYVPAEVTYAAIALLASWLPAHFHNRYSVGPTRPLSGRKKHLTAVAVAVLVAVTSAVSDDVVTPAERAEMWSAIAGALLTYFVPNAKPPAVLDQRARRGAV